MISDYNVIDTVLFSEPLTTIGERLAKARKDSFDYNDRIIIMQDVSDTYVYIDSPGVKLIEIQKIINNIDISNCFILIVTSNKNIENEINFVTKFYSIDPTPINFFITEGDYKKEITRHKNTACKKLWNHLYVGTDNNVNPCCIADHRFPLGNISTDSIDSIIHSDKANQIRQWMMEGYRSIACSPCYFKEDNNILSNREVCDASKEQIKISSLDIRLNNICNFKCRMCSEYFSSAIQQETIELYGKNAHLGFEKNSLQRPTSAEKFNSFKKIQPYLTKELQKIYFAGGEPLIMSEHYEILDRLLEIDNTNLWIAYSTNLSKLTFKKYNVIDYWNQFSNITVGASIDASDAVAEYVRHGTVWSDIIENIRVIQRDAPRVDLTITSTVSFLTIENLIRLQNQWINQGIFHANNLSLTVLTEPKYLSPAALPHDHKKRLSAIIQEHINRLGQVDLAFQWQEVLTFMNNNDYSYTLNDFKARTKILDQHRGESFIDVFPEFKDLYV